MQQARADLVPVDSSKTLLVCGYPVYESLIEALERIKARQCVSCDFKFTRYRSLFNHLERDHTGRRFSITSDFIHEIERTRITAIVQSLSAIFDPVWDLHDNNKRVPRSHYVNNAYHFYRLNRELDIPLEILGYYLSGHGVKTSQICNYASLYMIQNPPAWLKKACC